MIVAFRKSFTSGDSSAWYCGFSARMSAARPWYAYLQ
eukprot:CAMPEP_0195525104 /NCGR_PEP_ID=MMETSP0794_2-20130614/25340_1 /TAXON_ID=515487 /ORGANISM="Stephanopyxis turris, Strain CCMP 815" /LENGTH=36 /DNA_ID= /DNA_START= /DNA_END= /DNA_ORIENTATION=